MPKYKEIDLDLLPDNKQHTVDIAFELPVWWDTVKDYAQSVVHSETRQECEEAIKDLLDAIRLDVYV